MSMRHKILTVAFAVLLAGLPAVPVRALDNGLARTPPMGWNSWNSFHCDVSADLVEATADAMVASGMKDAGYTYVNIDDCWLLKQRGAHGELVPDPAKFPHGIEAVADYVHGKGLKLGIYESAGATTCAGYPGSIGHEKEDAAQFARWGVDYLKYDNCGDKRGQTYQQRYTAMRDALARSGRAIVYSICE
jgi:alpha-galactosidase